MKTVFCNYPFIKILNQMRKLRKSILNSLVLGVGSVKCMSLILAVLKLRVMFLRALYIFLQSKLR